LSETGYVEGKNVHTAFRWAEGQPDRLPALAADLVDRQMAVIVANGPSVFAAQAATATIPIVFLLGDDPIDAGIVTSFNRPSQNITGVSWFSSELGAKRLGLLHDLLACG
jgi:putative tryptophan/tyrosine transport system substrate-binding protein